MNLIHTLNCVVQFSVFYLPKNLSKSYLKYNLKLIDSYIYIFLVTLIRFRMKCHLCVNYIEMQTDPATCDYVIVSGAQRKEERWDMAENEQILTTGKVLMFFFYEMTCLVYLFIQFGGATEHYDTWF